MEQKIKQDSIRIGENIRRIRLAQHIKQTQLVQLLQLEGTAAQGRQGANRH